MTIQRMPNVYRIATEWLRTQWLPTATDGFRGLSSLQGYCGSHLLPCENDCRNAAPQLALCRLHRQSPRLMTGRDVGAAARHCQVLFESVPVSTVNGLCLRDITGGDGGGCSIFDLMHGHSRMTVEASLQCPDGAGGRAHYQAWPKSYDHRHSHPYNHETDHVGFSPARQASLAPSAKRREWVWGWVWGLGGGLFRGLP